MKFSLTLVAGASALAPVLCLAQPKLEEVVVTASRVETPMREVGVALSVLNADDLSLGSQQLFDALRTLPGISVSNQGGAGKVSTLRIRGEEGYRTLYLIDGVEVSDPSAPQATAYVQHLGGSLGLDRVEVLRGPQGFVYGADAGGVVNILTLTPQQFSGALSAEYGSFNSQNIQGYLANGDDRGSAFVSANYLETDGFNALKTDPTDDKDGYRNGTVHGKFHWQASDEISVQAVLRRSDAHNQYDNCGFPTTHDCADDTVQELGRLGVSYQSARSKQSFALSRSRTEREYFTDGLPGYAPQGRVEKAEYLGLWRVAETVHLLWGGDYKTDSLQTNYGDSRERHQTGLFTELQSELASDLYLSAGVRLDDNNEYGSHTSVRLAPAYVQTLGSDKTIKYRASYGTGFRAPSLSELAYNTGPNASGAAAGLVPGEEQSQGFDLGVDIYLGAGSFSIGYFDQQIEDEIYFDLLNYSGYMVAQGISHSKGWELALNCPLGEHWSIAANYTYNTTETEADSARLRRPKHLANVEFGGRWWQDRLHLLLQLRGAADAIDTGEAELPDYVVVNLSGEFAFDDRISAFLRMENAADKDYVEVVNYNTAERSIYGGLRLMF